MAEKFLERNASTGKITENEGLVTSAGAGDAGKIPALDAGGKLDVTLLPNGVGPATALIIASENLAAGDFVNVYDNAGTPTVRKADNSNGRQASGYVTSAVTSGNNATVYFEGQNNQVSGLTAGQRLYLGTAGAVTSTVPLIGGGALIHQYLGRALSATLMDVELDDEVVLA
jgi:hypothetical protein